ncbi:oxidation resistance protein [Verticillium dahliae VdLs.17]|uniref:Oxidation resistance protein 1 n=1 Tax=Verticillium dahliae (strain VdLs.17 / ATCC MYA-4575 / FGSC 10137) TaxID=498257 RepID=G2XH30_VERDV|nr:oxidation resistance protein [Verticillium dahliae VdLs.17]EGY19128.1 oxidation resistance protein [Verticillium dahliae VdLs.17]
MWSSLTRHFSSADMAADDAAPGPRHLAHAHTDPLAGVTGAYTPPHQRRTAKPLPPAAPRPRRARRPRPRQQLLGGPASVQLATTASCHRGEEVKTCFLWRASALAALPPPPSADAAPARSTTIAPDLLTGEDAPAPPASPAAAAAAPPPPALRFKAFPYSGENEYCINCETGFLSMGAGDGHYGLWLDGGLARGRSGRSLTFGNEPLSDEGDKFGVLGVELWVLGA